MAGKLIVIEGLDGSGKATQSQLVTEALRNKGYKVKKLTFPDYESDSSALVKMYLSGKLGDKPDDVNAYQASAFYAVDRVASYLTSWKTSLEECDYVILDRYTTSNIIYQMSKLSTQERDEFISWCEDLEYNRFSLPKPDKVIYLDMPPEVSQQLMLSRYSGDEEKKDIHEKNMSFLLSCRESAMYAIEKLSWTLVTCAKNSKPRKIEDITTQLLDLILQIDN